MNLKRRDFLRYSAISLSSLVLEDLNLFSEEQGLILPTLEEITKNLSRTYEGVLEPVIKGGGVTRFRYDNQTKTGDLYEFLKKEFKNIIVFAYFDINDKTRLNNKDKWSERSTHDKRLSAGSATIFLYTMLNLKKSNSDIGFLFLELVDFHREENWEELKRMFDNKLKGFPSYVEFKRTNSGTYIFNHISGSSQRDPQTILKWIGEYVEDFRKRTSK